MKAKVLYTYFDENNTLVTVYASRKVLKSEKTFKATKYSVYNIGHQAIKLSKRNVSAFIDSVQ